MSVFLGLVKYFGKKFIDISFQKEIENHKQELVSKTETLKNELAIYSHEQTTRFSRLDEKRAAVLEEIFESIYRIQKLIYDGESFAAPNFTDYKGNLLRSDELTRELSEAIRELAFYRGVKKIYFSPELDKLLSDASVELTKVREVTYCLSDYDNLTEQELMELQAEVYKKWIEVHKIYYDNFAPLKDLITTEFRKSLGVK